MKVGFIADIHEDIIRLREALDILDEEKCDKIVCLGDILGYSVPFYGYFESRNAHETIELLKERCHSVVVGNHDLFAIRKLPEHNAGFVYPDDWYSLDFQTRKKLSNNEIWLYEHEDLPPLMTSDDENFIKSLPEFIVEDFEGVKVFISHYAYPDLVGTKRVEFEEPVNFKEHFEYVEKLGCNLSISGHEHHEGTKLITEKSSESISFNKFQLTSEKTWLSIPCLANGSCKNGLMILDTEKLLINSIPLNSNPHNIPEWKKL